MNVVLDTNVLISGIFWKGASNKIILAWKENRFNYITSFEIISEFNRVLNDFKIKLPKETIVEWVSLLIQNSQVVQHKEKFCIIKEDLDDNKFLEAAVSGNADYIVSRDNHLLKLKKFQETKILTPYEFIKLL